MNELVTKFDEVDQRVGILVKTELDAVKTDVNKRFEQIPIQEIQRELGPT